MPSQTPKRLTRSERQSVWAKYDGRCAYCGVELAERWHVDHLKPVRRRSRPGADQGAMRWPKRDALDNCMPSCAPCNIDKHARSLEQWREWLQAHLRSLQRQPNYRLVRAHGLVSENDRAVVFYFERRPPVSATVEPGAPRTRGSANPLNVVNGSLSPTGDELENVRSDSRTR